MVFECLKNQVPGVSLKAPPNPLWPTDDFHGGSLDPAKFLRVQLQREKPSS
ncbi:hypothetical protein Syun_011733 [Stephania yunnanensis]|uniref:Uncharacterized protein n=1 Tax=Stephania yunnanensis TaxID=152371 RepID=A0AAP0JY37_9MAGN